jgi:hypothetical protein
LREEIYDLVAEDAPDHTTSQAEQFETLATTLSQVLPFGPVWAKVLISMSEIRNKQALLQMMDQAGKAAPPMVPKATVAFQWNELSQQEKMALAAQFQWPILAQVEQQTPSEPANLTQNKAEIVKTKMKTDADLAKAIIAAGTAHRGHLVQAADTFATHHATLEKAAMDNMTRLHQQQMQNDLAESQDVPEESNA